MNCAPHSSHYTYLISRARELQPFRLRYGEYQCACGAIPYCRLHFFKRGAVDRRETEGFLYILYLAFFTNPIGASAPLPLTKGKPIGNGCACGDTLLSPPFAREAQGKTAKHSNARRAEIARRSADIKSVSLYA